MNLLSRMETFVRVVHAGSLSAAARQLRVSTAAVSRHLSELEHEVGASLVARTTRRMTLTSVGQRYFERCQRVLAEVAGAQAVAGELADSPIRISMPVSVGVLAGAELMSPLLTQHPELRIDLRLEDRLIDLALDDVDIAVRVVAQPPMSDQIIAVPLSTWSRILVAAPSYLRTTGTPASVEDLAKHVALASGRDGRGTTWNLINAARTAEVRVNTRFATNGGHTLRELAIAGHGVTLLPPWFVAPDLKRRRLVHVLPGWAPAPTVIYLLYRAELRKQRPVKIVVDYLRRAYPASEHG